ncbi:minichromosome maintenance protein 5 [Binucleata daphniae]
MTTTLDLLTDDVHLSLSTLFLNFIDSFVSSNSFTYHSQLTRSILSKQFTLTIYLPHISLFSSSLHDAILTNPSIIFAFEDALLAKYTHNITLHFTTDINYTQINLLNSSYTNKIVRIRGIVISTSLPVTVPKKIHLTCKKCLATTESAQFMPRQCINNCGLDTFYIEPEKCVVVDEQFIKIQELFEDINVGEMPRHFTAIFEKNLVDTVCPGERIALTGILQMKNKLCMKVLGVEKEKRKKGYSFTEEEKEMFKELAPKIKPVLNNFFAPQIHGHVDIKKALLCMLFGETRRYKHGVSLRGDINILLLGDPGTAKSQLLKFTNAVSPGVYTSGKGSSAAGLTASVIRNKRGEFYLEGGALVLSDNGVCCIDEFDKMDVSDRVAIHEAMEQQTISINKAGINTVLSTKCSILAAANPIFGRYNDYKGVGDNIDFGSTILSRFDCIFIVQDIDNKQKDERLAKHILDLHKQKDKADGSFEDESFCIKKNKIDESDKKCDYFYDLGINKLFKNHLEFLAKYIAYSKKYASPNLTESAKEKLTNFYVETRIKSKQNTSSKKIPITVRQLESLIRLSESLARMELRNIVNEEDVNEAIRLFTVSTVNAANKGHVLEGMGSESVKEIVNLSEKIKKIIPIGFGVSFDKIVNDLETEEEPIIKKAVEYLEKNGKIAMKDNGRIILRLK